MLPMQDVAIWSISVDVVKVALVGFLMIFCKLNVSYSLRILLELLLRGLSIETLAG